MITVGIDVGSLSTKAVVLDDKNTILSYSISLTSGHIKKASENVFSKVLEKAKVQKKEISYIISTGYGRDNIDFANESVTEITCHALGAFFLFPDVRTIIDIGGQDSKVIKMGNNGKVFDFMMNDKCAAGTGRFLEVMAHALDVKLEDLGELSSQSKKIVFISSMCTVFAESEIVSLVAEGCVKPDIIRGVHDSVVDRVIALAKRVNLETPLVMTGGVAKNRGVIRALEDKLAVKISIPEEPQITGALGAALIAKLKKDNR
ncbi:MAG: acyl-CoA dehydratase activase [bacterium]